MLFVLKRRSVGRSQKEICCVFSKGGLLCVFKRRFVVCFRRAALFVCNEKEMLLVLKRRSVGRKSKYLPNCFEKPHGRSRAEVVHVLWKKPRGSYA